MNDRMAAALIVATALAVLAMGACLTRTTGATVIGSAQPGAHAAAQLPPQPAAQSDLPAPVAGQSPDAIALIPDETAVTRAVVAEVLRREHALAEPRLWTVVHDPQPLLATEPAGKPDDAEAGERAAPPRLRAVVLIESDRRAPAGELTLVSVSGGRASEPWLRRAFRIAAEATGVGMAVPVGWSELRARSGVASSPALAAFLRPAPRMLQQSAADGRPVRVPAIGLRIGLGGDERGMAGGTDALRVVLAVLDQVQTEPRLPAPGPDQFAVAPGTYLTPGATRWLWVFPLLPLTLGTGARYAAVAARAEFGPLVWRALRRLIWWCIPCLGGVVLLAAVPHAQDGPLPGASAAAWVGGVVMLVGFAAVRLRATRAPEASAALGGALVMDLLWSTYLIGAIVRPWTVGVWLAPAVFLWPWVLPVAGSGRALVALAWLGGAAPPVYWLLHVPGGDGSRVLAILGWLAAAVPPWGLLLGGFATAAGLSLGSWAATAAPLQLPEPQAPDA